MNLALCINLLLIRRRWTVALENVVRERRKAEREENSRTEYVTEEETAAADSNIIEEKAYKVVAVTKPAAELVNLETEGIVVAENADDNKVLTNIEAALETSNVVENESNREMSNSLVNVETKEAEVNKVVKSDPEEIRDKVNQLDTEPKPVRSAVETVFATAVIGDTDTSNVTNVQLNALLSIIRSKHLSRNITSVNIGSVQSYQLGRGKFEHVLQIMIHVNTANLWENARSYIFHHLGRDIWNLRDGTEVKLKRIHQKT